MTSKTVAVTVNGDTLKEGNETFKLNLSAPTNGTLADTSGTATIIDEEGPHPRRHRQRRPDGG